MKCSSFGESLWVFLRIGVKGYVGGVNVPTVEDLRLSTSVFLPFLTLFSGFVIKCCISRGANEKWKIKLGYRFPALMKSKWWEIICLPLNNSISRPYSRPIAPSVVHPTIYGWVRCFMSSLFLSLF